MTEKITSEELKALLEKAAPGPWDFREGGAPHYQGLVWDEHGTDVAVTYNDEGAANAQLIALSPSLAAEVLEARERIAKLEQALTGLLKATRKANRVAEMSNDEYADTDSHFVGEWIDEARATLNT